MALNDSKKGSTLVFNKTVVKKCKISVELTPVILNSNYRTGLLFLLGNLSDAKERERGTSVKAGY